VDLAGVDLNSMAAYGGLVVVVAVLASLVVRGVKKAIPELYHDFVPLGMTVAVPPLCSLVVWLLGFDWRLGLFFGILSTAGAVYGWAFVVKTIKGVQSVRDAAGG